MREGREMEENKDGFVLYYFIMYIYYLIYFNVLCGKIKLEMPGVL